MLTTWRMEAPRGRRSPLPVTSHDAEGKRPDLRRTDPAYGCVDWFEYGDDDARRMPARAGESATERRLARSRRG